MTYIILAIKFSNKGFEYFNMSFLIADCSKKRKSTVHLLYKPTCKTSCASNEYITHKSYLQRDRSAMGWTMLPVGHAWISQGSFYECRFFMVQQI